MRRMNFAYRFEYTEMSLQPKKYTGKVGGMQAAIQGTGRNTSLSYP